MKERRKYKRLPIKLELTISKLFKQDNLVMNNINENIEIKDISKSGIGFECTHQLPLDYYFDAKIELDKDKFFYTVLKIVRIKNIDKGYFVGCEFVGLADILSSKIDEYYQQ